MMENKMKYFVIDGETGISISAHLTIDEAKKTKIEMEQYHKIAFRVEVIK